MLLKNNKRRAILYGIVTAISLVAAAKNASDIFMLIPFGILSGVFGYKLITLKKKEEE